MQSEITKLEKEIRNQPNDQKVRKTDEAKPKVQKA